MAKQKAKAVKAKVAKATTPKCPKCKSISAGRVDTITGVAEITEIRADGTVDFSGETEVDWDSQRPAHEVPHLECMDCGHQAPAAEFLPPGLKVNWEE